MLVRAELGIESPAGAGSGLKPGATMCAGPNIGAPRHCLPELQPKAVEQTSGTKFPFRSFGHWIPNNHCVKGNGGSTIKFFRQRRLLTISRDRFQKILHHPRVPCDVADRITLIVAGQR